MKNSELKIYPLNEMDGETSGNPSITIDDVLSSGERHLYGHAFIVFSSRRTNPSGRGKVGWSAGAKVSNAFMSRSD